MSDKPISDLRRRMIADMTVRSFSDKTQHEYIRQIATLPDFSAAGPRWARHAVRERRLCLYGHRLQQTIAADPKHLGASIGITAVLHTWGSAMTHHPQCT